MEQKEIIETAGDAGIRQTKEKNEFEDIFREMLSIEDTKNLSSKVKYCLIKISIDNFNEISSLMKAEEKNSLIYKFSNFLFKNLRKKDIYLMSEPGKFLVIFPDISVDAADTVMKRIIVSAEKEFSQNLKVSWDVLVGTNKEEEIKPFIRKSDLISNLNKNPTTGRVVEKVILKKQASSLIFRNFLISFILFALILIAGITLIFYGTSRFYYFPGYEAFENFLQNMMPGAIRYFSSINIKATPFLFFIVLILSLSLTFGLGMFTGFIINLKMKNSGTLRIKIAALQSKNNAA